jgi:hypothetical protein
LICVAASPLVVFAPLVVTMFDVSTPYLFIIGHCFRSHPAILKKGSFEETRGSTLPFRLQQTTTPSTDNTTKPTTSPNPLHQQCVQICSSSPHSLLLLLRRTPYLDLICTRLVPTSSKATVAILYVQPARPRSRICFASLLITCFLQWDGKVTAQGGCSADRNGFCDSSHFPCFTIN